MTAAIDLTGERFGRWAVVSDAGAYKTEARARRLRGSKGAKWLCRCDCGTEREVYGYNLRSGASRSCGCWSAEMGRAGGKVPL